MAGFIGRSGNQFNGINALSFNNVEAIVVSGDGPNFCGHMLLRVDNYVFHFAGVYDYPKFMAINEYPLYIKQNGKTELFRTERIIHNKAAAKKVLQAALKEKWLWLVLPNNCADFVEEIIAAGENNFGIISNCPSQLIIKIEQDLRRKNMRLTRRGYRAPK